jgi:fructose-bisphosphate aldolase class I
MDGAHDLERCAEMTEYVLKKVFMQLYEARVRLEGIVLKPNMIVSGKTCPRQASPDEAARATLQVLRHCVPVAVPGIAFLSGGQGDIEATRNLDAINRLAGPPDAHWPLTFSYGRALQDAAMSTWAGNPDKAQMAQDAFRRRAGMNGMAAQGRWSDEAERIAA